MIAEHVQTAVPFTKMDLQWKPIRAYAEHVARKEICFFAVCATKSCLSVAFQIARYITEKI